MILMSNNQWKCDTNRPAWIAMGEDCSAEGRVGGLVRAYKEILPDVIGLQEVSMHTEDLMMQQLRSFTAEDGSSVHYDLITGGDTLLQCMYYMGIQEIEPLGELDRGVVLSRFSYQGYTRYVISKSGGFGKETLFTDLAKRIAP